MDKIDSLGESFSYKHLKKKSKKNESGKVTKFGSLLNRIEENEKTAAGFEKAEELESEDFYVLLDEITDFGEEMSKRPTLPNIKKYKEKVKQFIAYLVSNNLEISEKISGRNVLKRKKYMIITVIDKKLEELAKAFLMGQGNSLKILEKVEEINGLLVDLLR